MNAPIPLKNRETGSYGDNVNAAGGSIIARQLEAERAQNVTSVEATEEVATRQKYRLTKPHREALNNFLLTFPTLVGIHPQELADRFNVAYQQDWPVPVTRWHVLGLAQLIGYRTLNYRLVRYSFPKGGKPEVIEPSPVAAAASVAPLNVLAPTAVTMYRAIDGTLHATPEEALDAGKAEEFGSFIHDNCALHTFDAKQLAVSILKNYTVSKK
jgi:hypothetical protein